ARTSARSSPQGSFLDVCTRRFCMKRKPPCPPGMRSHLSAHTADKCERTPGGGGGGYVSRQSTEERIWWRLSCRGAAVELLHGSFASAKPVAADIASARINTDRTRNLEFFKSFLWATT